MKALAVVLQITWGAKNKRAFKVSLNFGSFLSLSRYLRCLSQHMYATEARLARMPPICMNWEKSELESPVTKVTLVTEISF